jgi:hypothetical protein
MRNAERAERKEERGETQKDQVLGSKGRGKEKKGRNSPK